MGVVLLDSAPIVGFLEPTDAFHTVATPAVEDVFRNHTAIISIVTFAELLVGAHLGYHNETVIRGFLRDLISEIVPVEREVAERAAAFRGTKKSLKLPDALIIATADLRAEKAVTGDTDLKGLSVGCEVKRLIPVT